VRPNITEEKNDQDDFSGTTLTRYQQSWDREIAPPDGARAILKLKGMDEVNF
jgi:hypothetical protein